MRHKRLWPALLRACLLAGLGLGLAAAAVAQTTFASNTFAGTPGANLSTFTPAVGGPWTAVSGSALISSDATPNAYTTTGFSTKAIYVSPASLPSQNLTLNMDLPVDSTSGGAANFYLQTGTSGTFYTAGLTYSNGTWYVSINKYLSGNSSTLTTYSGDYTGYTPTAGGTAHIKLTYNAGSFSLYLNGSSTASCTATDTTAALTAVGLTEWTGGSNGSESATTGLHAANFVAQYTASGTVTGVSVSPSAVTVAGGTTEQFSSTVTVTGGASQAVTWGTTAGTVTSGGLFTAPAATSSPQTVTVTATSVQNTALSGTATVTVPAARPPQGWYFSASTGSDSTGTGSIGSPYASVAQANSLTYIPGDSINFAGGQTFSGNLTITASGTAALPITVQSYGAGQATIDPSAPTSPAIAVTNAQYVHLLNLAVAGPGVPTSGLATGTTSTTAGIMVNSTAVGPGYLYGDWVTGCTVSGVYEGICAQSSTQTVPTGLAGLRITGCTVHDTLSDGILVQAISDSSDYAGNTSGNPGWLTTHVHLAPYVAADVVYHVYGDTTLNSGHGILLVNCAGGTVERCLVHDCGQSSGTVNGGPAGIWCASTSGLLVQDCECYGEDYGTSSSSGDGDGFDADGGSQGCVFQYDYSHDNQGSGFLVGGFSGGAGPATGNVFRFDVSVNDSNSTSEGAYRYFGTETGTALYNCLALQTPAYTGAAALLQPDYNWTVADCILYAKSSGRLSTGSYAPAVMAGNLYYNGTGTWSGETLGGTSYPTYAAFQSAVDAAGAFAAPGWPPPSGTPQTPLLPTSQVWTLGAYDIGASSPAQDAGVDPALYGLSRPALDLAGSRVGSDGHWPVGPVQYPPPTPAGIILRRIR